MCLLLVLTDQGHVCGLAAGLECVNEMLAEVLIGMRIIQHEFERHCDMLFVHTLVLRLIMQPWDGEGLCSKVGRPRHAVQYQAVPLD